jgi:hypothetical protein
MDSSLHSPRGIFLMRGPAPAGSLMYFSPPSRSNPSKSFRRLLLSLFVPVTPLGAHSYKKMGGVPHPGGKDDAPNTGFNLCGVSQNGTHIVKLACRPPAARLPDRQGQVGLGRPACRLGRPVLLKPVAHLLEAPRGCSPAVAGHPADIDDTNSQCFLSLTRNPAQYLQKRPNVFYHLQAMFHVSTSLFYHLRKRRGVGVAHFASRCFLSGWRAFCVPMACIGKEWFS